MNLSLTRMIMIAGSSLVLQAAVPEGWYVAGSKPGEYDCSRDPGTTYQGLPSSYLRSKEGVTTTGFGTLMQDFNAANYLGKRVEFSAAVKAEGVTSWAGLWMRVDNRNATDKKNYTVAFDNMQHRAITGTTGWQRFSVVLDVPQEATGIFLGILLDGPGVVWMSGGKFEVVGADVPTTNVLKPSERTSVAGHAVVTKTDTDLYHIVLPAKARWGASIPNPGGQEVTVFNVAGRVCWDPHPGVPHGCNGPEGSGRIPLTTLGQPADFLAPDKAAGSLVTKWEGGLTYFSINDRSTAFDDNEGQFEFDVKLAGASQK